jgi:anti-sigma factor RsiW
MNCRHLENELALYVEGDLPPARTSWMDMHLLSCEQCRHVVEELRETQSVFKSIRQDTVSPQEVAHLRTRVLGQVAARTLRPPWGRWVYALAGLVFVVAVAVRLLSTDRHPAARVQQVVAPQVSVPQSPPFQGQVAQTTSPIGRSLNERSASPIGRSLNESRAGVVINEQPPRPRLRRGHSFFGGTGMENPQPQTPAEPPKEIMVKLLTDDPNVVIYWLVDQNGGAL